MNNNDKLVRIRYALDIKDTDMRKIFELGGEKVTKEDLAALLNRTASKNQLEDGEYLENEYELTCPNRLLETFYNGLITFKRGKRPLKPGEVEKPLPFTMTHQNGNNVMLKKLKIAMNMTSEDMLKTLELAGVVISASELSALFRKEGTKNYQMCGDRFARNYIKGLGIQHRQ